MGAMNVHGEKNLEIGCFSAPQEKVSRKIPVNEVMEWDLKCKQMKSCIDKELAGDLRKWSSCQIENAELKTWTNFQLKRIREGKLHNFDRHNKLQELGIDF